VGERLLADDDWFTPRGLGSGSGSGQLEWFFKVPCAPEWFDSRVSNHQNDENLSQISLRYLALAQVRSKPSPVECIFGCIPFSRRWDTVRYSGIQQIQLDTYGYSWIQWDTAYSGIRWICCTMARYRDDTAGYQGYGKIYAGYRWNMGGISQKYTPGEGLGQKAGVVLFELGADPGPQTYT